ncbi:unnamed protein product [Adineta ricciae]|uniref:(S)-2-hydroxy-acid oxidase n=3 Tax=Adineta ricciae TaxID=249248 RepID=A0A815V682_ADIRI|nr:unnamed protein product [Adineta ricciae]
MHKASENSSSERTKALLNIEDYHKKAKEKLEKMTYDFYSTGSDDQLTLIDNQAAFRRIKLRPKMLIDVSSHTKQDSTNCQTQILNSTMTIGFPCIIAPTAFHRLVDNENGELATVRAAVAHSTIMCVSTNSSTSMERVAEEHRRQIKENYPHSTSKLWYQLYVLKDRQYTQKLIKRAEKNGYSAILLTVDTSVPGNRECDVHNNFTLPDGIRAENLIDKDNNYVSKSYHIPFDPSLSWKDLDWIRSITSLPLIIKGIIHPDDARQAVRHGVQGVVVSNHGGRQLDTCLSTIDALPDVIKAVSNENRQIDVFVDGGVRRGTDILKAIALGAKAVLIGRPVLWGLAVDGTQGVYNILEILKKEFRLAMMLCGCQTIDDIRKNDLVVTNVAYNPSKL